MKRFPALLCTLALLSGLILSARAVSSAGITKARFYSETVRRYEEETTFSQVNVTLDGAPLDTDAPALLRGGRTLVPVRAIAEGLGATVLWVGEARQVVIRTETDTIVLTLGSAEAVVNGERLSLPDGIPAEIVSCQGAERTMVPLRFVSERLHAQVDWDNDTCTAIVTSAVQPEDPAEIPGTELPPVEEPADGVTAEEPSYTYTVCLDAGHGGWSLGAAYEEIQEKDLTLPITLRTAELLEEKGYRVILTRWSDVYVDLYERCAIANEAEADIFVSIHCNASATNRDFQGTFTYSYPGSVEGKKLARCIQDGVVAAAGSIDRGLLTNNYVVLRETIMPAALVETGFMSCSEELARLADPDYQELLSQGIAQGIEDYLSALPSAAEETETEA